MANTAEKNAKKRRAEAQRNWVALNLGFLLFFFLMRFYLRPRPLAALEWLALAVNLAVQAAATYTQLSVYESMGTSNDAAVDLLGMAFAALLFAAFDRRGWIFTVLAPFVGAYFMYSGGKRALGKVMGKAQGDAPDGAAGSGAGAEGKGGVRRR